MASGEFILEARGLSKEFLGFAAVRNVDLKVRRGSLHALIGPNGAGKTTVFNLLTRFLQPTSGTILFNGADITRETPVQVARRGLVRSFQISATFPHLSVLENVRVALQRAQPKAFRQSYQFWRHESALDELNGRALELLESVDLSGFAQRITVELPYGRKRALEIATTLALDPELMLLDEPTQGMGHEDVGRVVELIRKVARDRTILMVEHNLSVVETLSDTITVLQRGSVLMQGPYAEVSKDPRVLEAYVGVSLEEQAAGAGA
jgi:branched-chain amino acid transport system ATP-binding protein